MTENTIVTEDLPEFFVPAASFRARQRFTAWGRDLIRLPGLDDPPGAHLLPEARWQALLARAPDPEVWLIALSGATGVYFFPSREWPPLFLRYLKRLGVRRLLEAGAGRGYLAAALAPLAGGQGLDFLAVDRGEGEFLVDLAPHPVVHPGEALAAARDFRPEAVLYAWPPPGQSLAALFALPFLRYLVVVGEAGGGATGAREDWLRLPHKDSRVLAAYGRGRTGEQRHRVTVFWKV